MAGVAAPAAGSPATSAVPTVNALAIPPNIMRGEQQAGTPFNALEPTNVAAAGHPTAPAAMAPQAAAGPATDYAQQYAKSMAAARGAIAAQMASQMAEIQAAQSSGQRLASGMTGQYDTIQAGENRSLSQLAHEADAGAGATGIKSLGTAGNETGYIGAAGQQATDFAKSGVPMLQEGINLNASSARNALAVASTQANEQLDEQQAQFQASQAAQQEQERYSTQQNALAWSRSPENPDSPSYKAALTLKGLNPDGTPTDKAMAQAEQENLTKQNVTSFTAAQAGHVRNTPMYKYLASQLKGGTSGFSQLFNQQELNDPGVRLAVQVYLYDHGQDPKSIDTLTGRKGLSSTPGTNALVDSLASAHQEIF